MKAVIWTAYGPPEVLKLSDIAKPTPRDNEVLIKIHAANVTAGDCEQRGLKLPFPLKIAIRFYTGLLKPTRIKILGFDLSGEVEAIGSSVHTFKPGDKVFGTTGFINMGTYAEYICLPTDSPNVILTEKPNNLSWEEAAGIPTGGLEARHSVKMAALKAGMNVLIIGAAGTIGGFVVQLVKLQNAKVTAVDSSDKLDMLRDIGADEVIDYTKENIFERKEKYDVIINIAGKSPLLKNLKLLKTDGSCIMVNPSISQKLGAGLIATLTRKRIVTESPKETVTDLMDLSSLFWEGKLTSYVDRAFPLEQAAEAHRYVESGRKKGNVILLTDQTKS